MDPLKTGKIIMEARKRLNMTQKDLADKLFISDKAVSKWERGLSFPDIAVLIPLSEILNVNLNDLLKGEEMKEKQDDTILKETIKYSNKENKRIKKFLSIIVIVMSIITVILIGILLIAKLEGPKSLAPGDKFSVERDDGLIIEPYKLATKEKDDGWICTMRIDYSDKNNYDYNCVNLKYRDLIGYNSYQLNETTNQYYISNVNIPTYSNNLDYSDDLYEIDNYFHEKQFIKTITIDDLKGLKLKYINKEDVIELFNEAINSKLVDSYSKYLTPMYPVSHTEYTSDNKKTYVVGLYLDWGKGLITNLYIDIIKDGKYLKTNSDEYNKIQRIKNYILEKQEFIIPEELKNDPDAKELLKYNFHDINENIDNIDALYSTGVLRYVTDEKEMKNQFQERRMEVK